MDRANYELLTPLIVADRLVEARQAALADLAPAVPGIGDMLALHLGAVLIRLGCRLDAIGRRHEMFVEPFASPRLSVAGDQLGVRKRAER
jgi:hypothetical protein